MSSDGNSPKHGKKEVVGEPALPFDQVILMEISEIRMHPAFVDLLPIDEKLCADLTQDMRDYGYYPSEPVTLVWWPGLDKPVLGDGHARIRAALEAAITHVPAVIKKFRDELEAVQHVMNLQSRRRATTDGALYRLSEWYDRLLDRGGDRRSEEAESKGTRVPFDPEQCKSSQMTARLIGCNYKKVEKMRKIRRDGTPEIQEAVKNDKLRINSAYNKIRKMKQGQEDTAENSSAAQIKPLRITFSRESLALLQELGGDVGVHVNKALEVYKCWLQDGERPE